MTINNFIPSYGIHVYVSPFALVTYWLLCDCVMDTIWWCVTSGHYDTMCGVSIQWWSPPHWSSHHDRHHSLSWLSAHSVLAPGAPLTLGGGSTWRWSPWSYASKDNEHRLESIRHRNFQLSTSFFWEVLLYMYINIFRSQKAIYRAILFFWL